MPNGGFNGKLEEWERLEKPLIIIDETLSVFAKANGLQLSKNNHNWPARILKWGNKVIRQIEIYLNDENKLTFNISLCAYEDRANKRFWKHITLKKDVKLSDFSDNLFDLLNEGKSTLLSWEENDLEEAGVIGDPRRSSFWGGFYLDLINKYGSRKQ